MQQHAQQHTQVLATTAKPPTQQAPGATTRRSSCQLKPTCQGSKLEVRETTIFTQTIRNQQHMERTQNLNCNQALKLHHQHIQAIPSEQCFNRTESFTWPQTCHHISSAVSWKQEIAHSTQKSSKNPQVQGKQAIEQPHSLNHSHEAPRRLHEAPRSPTKEPEAPRSPTKAHDTPRRCTKPLEGPRSEH